MFMTPWERLDAELAKRRISWASLADALGTTKQAVGHWRTRGIPPKHMRGAAEFVGQTQDWLEFGPNTADLTFSSLKLDAFGTGPTVQRTKPRETIELENNPAYPAIRRVKLKASAGVSGYSVDYDKDDDGPPIVFRADWYKMKGFDPEKLLAMRVTGQSMRPKYSEGDVIVINTENTEPKDGLIYLVRYEGEFTVKRMVRDSGEWWLSSDNPDQRRYPRKACNGDTVVIGKVVYHQTDNVDD